MILGEEASEFSRQRFIRDVGGEGRNADAWHLNPSRFRTFRPQRGVPITRLIHGRGVARPLADRSVDVLIVERTPLRLPTLREILRVARPTATVVLRHVVTLGGDPHRIALGMLRGNIKRRWLTIGSHTLRETTIRLAEQ